MTNIHQKKQEKKGVNPVAVAVAGAVVGAGIAVAGVALHDEKNRKKVQEIATKVKDRTVGYMENMKKQAQDKKQGEEKKMKLVVNTAKKSLHKAVKDVNKAVQTM